MSEFQRDPVTKRISARGALQRSRDNRVITGLAGGIAELLGVRAGYVRIVFVAVAVLTLGTFVLVYLLLSLMLKSA
jgi:phage shock protein PspC (stress-responsive transcriptional regulator)